MFVPRSVSKKPQFPRRPAPKSHPRSRAEEKTEHLDPDSTSTVSTASTQPWQAGGIGTSTCVDIHNARQEEGSAYTPSVRDSGPDIDVAGSVCATDISLARSCGSDIDSTHKHNTSLAAATDCVKLVGEDRSSPSRKNDSDSGDEDEPVLSYSKQQRWPASGEPVCVVCGRYGAYIVDDTDQDVCSLECKSRHLLLLGRRVGQDGDGATEEGEWVYREHSAVAQLTEAQVQALKNEVC